MVRVLQAVFTITGDVGLFDYVSTKDVVHSSGYTVDVLCFVVDVISQCHCDCIVHNHGVRTPFITVLQFLTYNAVYTVASFIVSNRPNVCIVVMTNIRNTEVRLIFEVDEVVSSLLYILLDGAYFVSRQQALFLHILCIYAQRECTQACQSTPCEGRTSTVVFTAIQSSIYAVSTSTCTIAFQIGLIGSVACSNVQFASCPVEFVFYISVTVRTTALILSDRSVQRFEVCVLVRTPVVAEWLVGSLCCLISLFSICQVTRSILVIILSQSCILSHCCCKVQSCCISNRLYNTSQFIISRSYAQCSPLIVVDLVVNHAVVSLHLLEEVCFHLYFVQDIRCAVAVFRNNNCARAICPLRSIACHQVAFIQVQQCPHGNTAVYNVFTVVTSVIPTTGYIDGTVVLFNRVFIWNDVYPLILDVSGIRIVTSLTSQLGLIAVFTLRSDVSCINIYTRTVLVEVVHCIGGHAIIDVVANVERQRSLAIASDGVTSAFGLEIREVDDLVVSFRTITNLAASGSISLAFIYNCTAGILNLEILCSGIRTIQNQSCLLFEQRIVTNLVYFYASRLISSFCIVVGLVIGHIYQSQVIELQQSTSFAADEIIVRRSTTEVERHFSSTLGILFCCEFPSVSSPLVCSYSRLIFPAVPAHTKINLFTSLGSTLQLFSQLLVIQGFIIIHLELVTVLVPVFQVIIGDVAQLTINLCILVRPDRICITISMTCFDGQTSVTELAVPTTFTVVGQTTRIGDQDVVAAICHFKLHGTSSTFTDMPRQTNTIVKSTGTEFFKAGCSGTCGNGRQTHCSCGNGHCCSHYCCNCLLTEFVFQHKYPP